MTNPVWLEHYPAGVPAQVDVQAYPSVTALLADSFERHADRVACVFKDRPLTYRQLRAQARAFAGYLQSKGFAKGDRVAVMLPNLPHYPVAVVGILLAGCVVVNVNPQHTPRELEHRLLDAGAAGLVIFEPLATLLASCQFKVALKEVLLANEDDLLGPPRPGAARSAARHVHTLAGPHAWRGAAPFEAALAVGRYIDLQPVHLGPDDLALLQYTGGATGVSKGATLLHRNLVASVLQSEAWYRPAMSRVPPGEQFTTVCALPLHHMFAFTANLLLGMRMGGCSVLISNPRNLPELFGALMSRRFHSFPAVNALYSAMLQDLDFDLVDWSGLVVCAAGGMAVQSAVARHWYARTGCAIVEGYGLSEASPTVTCNPVDGAGPGCSVGQPMPGTEVRLLDEGGAEVPPGSPGELSVRGPQVMAGYWRRPDETARAFTPEGFLRTGDIAVMDERGHFRIVDRKKDLIFVSGLQVYPMEIEEVVSRLPGVVECAAIGVPDAHGGEAVKLVVVAGRPGVSEADIRAHCAAELAGPKRPSQIEFVAALPKTALGKILRRELRRPALAVA